MALFRVSAGWVSKAFVLVWLISSNAFAQPVVLEYTGDLNRTNVIRLSLNDQPPRVSGSYFYKKWLKDIPLTGEYVGERGIVLREHDAQGRVTGTFSLEFVDKDPRQNFKDAVLKKEVLIGTWTGPDRQAPQRVYLRMTGETRISDGQNRYSVAGAADPALVERNAQAFYDAVLKGDRRAASRYASYPLSYNDGGQRKQAATAEIFVQAFSRIFTKSFVARIREGIPHNMFANSRGIMLGQGEVWFNDEGKAFSLNN